MKQRKIAISLAVVGALAAPLGSGTYKKRPTDYFLEPLTAQQKQEFTDYVAKFNNCQEAMHTPIDRISQEGETCIERLYLLRDGGEYRDYFSVRKYLARNVGAATIAFGVVFCLSYLLPALARRYWQWLNT